MTEYTRQVISGLGAQLLTSATGTGTAYSTQLNGPGLDTQSNYYATLGATAAAAATAIVTIYGSITPMATAVAAEKKTIVVLSLSGTGVTDNNTTVSTDSQDVGAHRYPYIWAEVTAISGTGAKVNAWRIT